MLAVLLLVGAWSRRRRGRGSEAGGRDIGPVSCRCEELAPAPAPQEPRDGRELASCQLSARQVFDVQWSFSGRVLIASGFKQPAGTDASGRFMRPPVDQDADYYRLVPSEAHANHYALQHYGATGALKNQLSTYGNIRAISSEAILYSGDGQYGTLLTLKTPHQYGDSVAFRDMTIDPTQEVILQVLNNCPEAPPPEPMWGPGPPVTRTTSPGSAPGSRVHFKAWVSCVCVRHLTEMPLHHKSRFWWQPDDFAEFLKVRVEIGKAYRAAAKQLGVDVMNVTSIGSHGEAGYKAMIQSMPQLAGESRRGLGLGRKRQRAKNRDAYIAAVLQEQSRLRQALEDQGLEPSGTLGDLPHAARTRLRESLACAARRVSAKDQEYAHFLAQTYFEQDRRDDAEEPEPAQSQWSSVRAPESGSSLASMTRCDSVESFELEREDSFTFEEGEEDDGQAASTKAAAAKHAASKGFGLSREMLEEAGLSVTGHAISRYQRLRTLPGNGHFSDDGAESDVTDCSSAPEERD